MNTLLFGSDPVYMVHTRTAKQIHQLEVSKKIFQKFQWELMRRENVEIISLSSYVEYVSCQQVDV